MTAPLRSMIMLLVAFLAGLASLGCHGSSEFMRPVTPAAIAPAPDAATVVFVRPSGYAGGIVTTIVDEHGRFLGDSEAESYFQVKVPPGEHMFVAWSEGTPALKASLAPGRVYFVEVAPKMGAWSARVQLLALTPRSESWPKLGEWLRESQPMAPDEAAGQARMAERGEDLRETLQKGVEELGGYDPEELAARTLGPQDGVAAPVGPGGAIAAPAAMPAPVT